MEMKRVLLKLSGEALAGEKKTGFDEDTVKEVARQVKLAVDAGTEVALSSEEETSGEDARAMPSTALRQIRSVCLPL